jgi:hypothetical protein
MLTLFVVVAQITVRLVIVLMWHCTWPIKLLPCWLSSFLPMLLVCPLTAAVHTDP